MTTIAFSLQAVRTRVELAAIQFCRAQKDISLLAVSKSQSVGRIRDAVAAGQRTFGESYAQEGEKKIFELADLPLEWHFIGPIQSNKTKVIAENFDWVHSIDRLKIAERLAAARPRDKRPLQICVQLNVSGEASKQGVTSEEAPTLLLNLAKIPQLQIRGLMTIPKPCRDFGEQRQEFKKLRELKEKLCQLNLPLDTLSMGMSEDLEAAIAEGATIVRIGSAIFGERVKAISGGIVDNATGAS